MCCPSLIPLFSRLLKKSASDVLARHCRLTVSAAFTDVPCRIRHDVNLRGSTYSLEYTLPLRTLGAHGTRPAHQLAGVHRRAMPYRHGVDLALVRRRRGLRTLPAHRLAGAHKHGALSSSRRAPHYSSRRGPRWASPVERASWRAGGGSLRALVKYAGSGSPICHTFKLNLSIPVSEV